MFLEQIKPEIILIEGLSDANESLLSYITDRRTKPPIAILAYTNVIPVRTLLYPIASYSPEYQALQWAKKHDTEARFIDLPSDIFLALQGIKEKPDPGQNKDDNSEEPPLISPHESPYDRFARQAGEPDYETYWERNFEHNLNKESYRLAAYEFGKGLRDMGDDHPDTKFSLVSTAETLVREAFMRCQIQMAIDEGYKPEKIAVIVGAYHAPVMTQDAPVMTDDELEKLPRTDSKLTLMPYSYFKLSSQSGYGAGNHAPLYFEMMWQSLQKNDLANLPAEYLSRIVRNIRESGTSRSTAEVIEGVRLANTLAALKKSSAPTLYDLKDAAITLIGYGEKSVVAEAMARVEIGSAIGELPEGVSQTAIQDDFYRQIRLLKLEKYRTGVKQDLELDLRENRRVKSEEAAFLDLNRSFFLHQLNMLGIGFALKQQIKQDAATWKEKWSLQWTPESEIALVEAVLLGETVELATAYRFKTTLEKCKSVADAALILRQAWECGMAAIMDQARQNLQHLASESAEFTAIAQAANELGMIVRYGDVRRINPEPLKAIIEQLFLQGSLLLLNAANCDNNAAKTVLNGISVLNQISLEYDQIVDEPLWISQLHKLSDADHLNPLLSGYACAILLERQLIKNDELAREVSRRLSPGISADLGAGWFEGLSKRNRYALLARLPLWEQLALYVAALDDEQFTRALVFLRRAFGGFTPREKRTIAENLGEIWGVNSDAVSEVLNNPLSEHEEQKIKDLNDFNFDDI